MGGRELPVAMSSFCWKNLSSTSKYGIAGSLFENNTFSGGV
jgi:hypothetical protein